MSIDLTPREVFFLRAALETQIRNVDTFHAATPAEEMDEAQRELSQSFQAERKALMARLKS